MLKYSNFKHNIINLNFWNAIIMPYLKKIEIL